MSIILRVILISFVSSCSFMNLNQTKKGEIALVGGVYHETSWDDKLTFKRTSFYQDLSLVFDVNLVKLTEASPFFAWASEDEKKTIKECPLFVLSFHYSMTSKKISGRFFLNQMENQGFKEVAISNFLEHMRLHPDLERNMVHQYKLIGLCRSQNNSEVSLEFPGYKTVKVHIN